MDEPASTTLERTLPDKVESAQKREAAARQLAHADDRHDIATPLKVAQDEDEDDGVASSVGAALAHVYIRLGQLYEAPLESFTGPAYEGFDTAVALYQTRNSTGRALR